MTAMTDLDRLVAAWLEAVDPTKIDDDAVTEALTTARRLPQRRGLRALVTGPAPWPRSGPTVRALPVAVRMAAVVALLVAALVTSAVVGSRLLRPAPILPTPTHLALLDASPTSDLAPSPAPTSPPPSVDPRAHGRYTPAPDLIVPRAGPIGVGLRDGRVLIIGGDWDASGVGEVFDPTTGTSATVRLPTDVTSTAVLPDGRVLMVGDHAGADPTRPGVSTVFDPVTMTVAPTRPQQIPRAHPNLAPLPDGRVLMVGGEPPHADGDEVGAVKRAEIFDPATDSWRLTGSLHTDRIGRDVTVLRDGRVFVATGFVPDGLPINVAGGGAAAEIYDPETGHWTRVFAFDARSPHGHLGSPIGLVDGRVAFESVHTNGNELLGYQLDFWDPRTNQFAPPVALPGLPQGHIVLDDGRLYFVGSNLYFVGSKDKFTMWSAIFDPRTNQITDTGATVAWAPTPVLLDDGRVLLVGGQTDGASVITMGPDHRIAPFVTTMEYFR